MQVIITEPADSDLDQIEAHIAMNSPAAALRMLERLTRAARGLEHMPNRGRPGRELETRELVVAPYVIVYRVRGDFVEVVRIRHHAQLR